METTDEKEVQRRLQEPFPPGKLQYKPGAVKENRAMVIWYIDARMVQDRLDEAVGAANWQVDFGFEGGFVTCRLSIKFNGEWVTKVDVGSRASAELNQPPQGKDFGEKKKGDDAQDMRTKGMFSTAFKRAAAMWGIGRYLYLVKNQWADYDPKARRFVKPPVFGAKKPAPKQEPPGEEERPRARPAHVVKRNEIVRLAKDLGLTREVVDRRIAHLFGTTANLDTLNDGEATEVINRLSKAVLEKQAGSSSGTANGQEYEEAVV